MSTIVTRAGKGSPLTNTELDSNFSNLNTDKAELSGSTFTGNLSLGDNVKLQLGNQTNGDLQLYHDGNHSWIKDAGAGNIYISSDGYAVNIVKGENTAAVASFIPDGPVNLYNAGDLRLATTSSGISVTGSVVADGLTVANTGFARITLQDSDATNQKGYIDSSGGDLNLTSQNGTSHGDIFLKRYNGTSTVLSAQFASNGDISFYNDSAAQAFHFDSSESVLSLGRTNGSSYVTDSDSLYVKGQIRVDGISNTAALPALCFNDTNTGIFYPAANSIGFSVGAYESLRLNADGSSVFSGAVTSTGLTVSTTYPKLQLNSTSGVARNFSVGTNNETFTIRNETASSDSLTISNANIVNIPQSLMVGATTAPLSILHIGSGADANVPITLAPATGGNVEFRNTSSTGSFTFTNANGSSEKLEINSSGNATFSGSVSTGNMTLSGQEIDVSSGDLTLDVAGDIILDADGGDILLKDGGAHWFNLANSSGANLTSMVQDADILLRGNDGGSIVTALTLDMSAAGAATFNSSVTSTGLTVSKTASGSTTQIASFVNPVGTANTGVRFWMSGTNTTTRGTFIDAVAESTSNNHTLRFGTSASSALPVERMRIDSLGNLLVGTTDTTIYNNLSGDGGIVLAKVTGGGRIDASRAGSCYTANRLGSDGQLFDFRKNGGIVGRISTVGNDLVIGSSVSGHKGVRFGSSYIAPINTIDAFEDNTTDLGLPAVRFKDLYLSNNATAQKLTLTKAPVGTYSIEVDGTNTGQPNLIVKQSTSERFRCDNNGNLLVGVTSTSSQISVKASSVKHVADWQNFNDGGYGFNFKKSDGSIVGTIAWGSSSTSYNTSSDQRLKENIEDADDAGSKIDAIQVRQYDWKADGSHQDYGMVAQELLEVAPEAVSGDADSEEMMGVDYSKLVPMLIKEIQSLRQRVAQLEE